jgi:uncharacterized phage infection (PIP) family protein YhgE
MLWALLALYFFGGSSGTTAFTATFEQAKAFIKTDIEDKARRMELLSLVEEQEKTTKERVKSLGKAVNELSDIAEKHDAKIGDFQPVLDKVRSDTVAYQDRMIRYRFDLIAKMSREEWSRAFPREESSPASKEVQKKQM